MEEKHIIAIEIGSSKIKGAIGVVDSTGALTVQSIDETPLVDCVRHGVIRNVAEVANALSGILRKIENRIAPRKVESVYVAIGGRSFCSSSREIERKFPADVDITSELINQLKKEALSTSFSDREVLEVVPRDFIIDNSRAEHPVGMYAHDIHMDANLITCRSLLKRNLDLMLIDRLNLRANRYIVRQLAEADFVLTPEERRLGCMLVDFGAETTTVSIYKYGRLQYMAVLPIGSRNITLDITRLNYTEERAEELKIRGGRAMTQQNASYISDDIDFSEINNYVAARAGEIIANIKEQVKYAGFTLAELPQGVVLVGKGAKLADFSQRLTNVTGMKVRSGNAMTGSVRIGDSRISPSDHIDIISILYAASKDYPVECLSALPVVDEPRLDDELEKEEPEDEKPQKKSKGNGGGFLGSLRNRIINLMNEPEEDDEDFVEDE